MARYCSTFLPLGPAGGRWRWLDRRTWRNSENCAISERCQIDLVRFYSKSAAGTYFNWGICCTFYYILHQVYINAVKISVVWPFSESGCDTCRLRKVVFFWPCAETATRLHQSRSFRCRYQDEETTEPAPKLHSVESTRLRTGLG